MLLRSYLREVQLLLEMFSDSRHVGSLDIFEINPMPDLENKTVELANKLISSLVGQRILEQ
ncbi:MAG: hypothetical protein BMS9Abin02_1102 [Anaerolineae bacterium]|nr:MAG: hypothetical protein BMS9Abin02_1102 [Anaerolineae bacterium]